MFANLTNVLVLIKFYLVLQSKM